MTSERDVVGLDGDEPGVHRRVRRRDRAHVRAERLVPEVDEVVRGGDLRVIAAQLGERPVDEHQPGQTSTAGSSARSGPTWRQDPTSSSAQDCPDVGARRADPQLDGAGLDDADQVAARERRQVGVQREADRAPRADRQVDAGRPDELLHGTHDATPRRSCR